MKSLQGVVRVSCLLALTAVVMSSIGCAERVVVRDRPAVVVAHPVVVEPARVVVVAPQPVVRETVVVH
jgi:hypothetical protein